MTHDPLCARTPTGVHYVGTCTCNLIAKVRADERKKAGARVANLTSWEDGWPENVVVSRMSAIYAAEGEENE